MGKAATDAAVFTADHREISLYCYTRIPEPDRVWRGERQAVTFKRMAGAEPRGHIPRHGPKSHSAQMSGPLVPGRDAAGGLVARGLAARMPGRPAAPPIDLSVGRGACLAITGPSGAGKSLLLRMLADLVPHAGEVWLDGLAQSAMPAPEWRRRLTYVATDAAWWAADVAGHFARNYDPVPGLRRLRLPEAMLSAAPDRLSTGERQRLNLLRAMAPGPAVLALDEPSSALDPEATGLVEDMLRDWCDAGGVLVLASHDAAQVGRLAGDRIVLAGAAP